MAVEVEFGEAEMGTMLTPGKYWLIVKGATPETSQWGSYRKALREEFGRASFKTVQTRENKDLDETWVVIEVKEPIFISDEVVTQWGEHEKGDHAESEGVWAQEAPDWIHEASETVDTVTTGVRNITGGVEKVAIAGVVLGLTFWLVTRK